MIKNQLMPNMGFLLALTCLIGLSVASLGLAAGGTVPTDERKHTTLGKYVNAVEAYEMWKASPDKVKLIDCRTPEEYAFVGHAPMANNVPSRLWVGRFDSEKKDYVLEDNPAFEEGVKRIADLEDTILIVCRSGHRSATAVNRLASAGYKNVYNVTDGFEGDKITDEDSYLKGKRMKNGWRNSGAPWTYDLDPKLVYQNGK